MCQVYSQHHHHQQQQEEVMEAQIDVGDPRLAAMEDFVCGFL
jgi:hypothetical protein